jgi:hypothetical protein
MGEEFAGDSWGWWTWSVARYRRWAGNEADLLGGGAGCFGAWDGCGRDGWFEESAEKWWNVSSEVRGDW